MGNNNLIELKQIYKTFKSVTALNGVDFSLDSGEIHALIGANGAGKSTLAKIISGIYEMTKGEYYFKGNKILSFSKKIAMDIGISMVMQETSLMPDLTVAENVFIHEYRKGFKFNHKRLIKQTELIFEELNVPRSLHARKKVRYLSMAERQLVEIAKSLAQNSEIIIFDEPTSSLSPAEVKTLYKIIRKLKLSGKGIIYVSHRLEEIFALADNITILRDGKSIIEKRSASLITQNELVKLMVGSELQSMDEKHEVGKVELENNKDILEVMQRNGEKPKSILKLKKGIITGLTGLVGAGRTELAQSIFGLQNTEDYVIKISDKAVNINSPKDAVKAGIAYIPENRGDQGLIKDFSTLENAMFSQLGITKGFLVDYKSKNQQLNSIIERMNLDKEVLKRNIMTLSGGMQQKIVIAKWLLLNPQIIILDEPTRGIDVGARAEIYQFLYSLREKGVAILVISSDFEEILTVADQVYVMSEGNVVAELPGKSLDKEKILMYALPRTSAKVIKKALEKLSSLVKGNPAFWITVDNENVYCLESTDNSHLIGLSSGQMYKISDSKIPSALKYIKEKIKNPVRIKEELGKWETILIPIMGKDNKEHGVLGVSIPKNSAGNVSVEKALTEIKDEQKEIEQVIQGFDLY